MSETPEDLDRLEQDDELTDFDAFWTAKARRGKRVRIMGQVVELPPALPLQFEMETQRLRRSKRDQDVRKLVGILFGADAVDRWAEAGMDQEQFQVLLAWAPRAIAGLPVTLEDVAAEVAALKAKALEQVAGQDAPDPT